MGLAKRNSGMTRLRPGLRVLLVGIEEELTSPRTIGTCKAVTEQNSHRGPGRVTQLYDNFRRLNARDEVVDLLYSILNVAIYLSNLILGPLAAAIRWPCLGSIFTSLSSSTTPR